MKSAYKKPKFLTMIFLIAALTTVSSIAGAANSDSERATAPPPESFKWMTVVNGNDVAPPGNTKFFNSFNQPSVNARAQVVFRARSRGPQRVSGIFVRDMSMGAPAGRGILKIFDLLTRVPDPNNLSTDFNEFPSIPRTAINSNIIGTRGNHAPVWQYADTRAGTSGLYVEFEAANGLEQSFTAMGKLGDVPGFDRFKVPGVEPPTPFEVFPGAPSVTDANQVVFKGNYTDDAEAKTGVFFRPIRPQEGGGVAPVVRIATSDTSIPDLPAGQICADPTNTFGSTAPPSAVAGSMVFLGVDDEAAPVCGGIYRAPLKPDPRLSPLVELGDPVPGVAGTRFGRIGEGLSYDGRFVGFWGSWGNETFSLVLICPTEGNRDRIRYCNEIYPNGFRVDVPLNQGIFVHDTRAGGTHLMSRTVRDFDDYLFWNFSGQVPGSGSEDDGEAARWRASSFVAVSSTGSRIRAVFKARTGEVRQGAYVDPVDGLYLARFPGNLPLVTVLDTTTPGQALDPEAPFASVITELGLERDGFRGRWLVINASMEEPGAEEEERLPGIYLAPVP